MTFGGVAAFAPAPGRRLSWVQLLCAILTAFSVLWCLRLTWDPVVRAALTELPERAEIRGGRLEWGGPTPARLGANAALCLSVDVTEAEPADQTADVQLELGRDALKFHSLLGYVAVPYPRGWVIALARADAQPWWGAWRPAFFAGVAAAVVAGLFVSWWLLAALYAVPVRLVAFYLDRQVTLGGCRRLAGAALLPGALVMSGAFLLYGLQQLNFIGLLLAWPLHLVIGWIYTAGATFRLPRLTTQLVNPANPFVSRPAAPAPGTNSDAN